MKRLTPSEKQLRGTYRPSREAKDDMQYTLIESMPDTPSMFGIHASSAWTTICEQLIQARKLTVPGLNQVERYCLNFDLLAAAKIELQESGALITYPNGVRAVNPAVRLIMDIQKQMGAFEKVYGLTPLAATALPPSPPAPDPDSEFDI